MWGLIGQDQTHSRVPQIIRILNFFFYFYRNLANNKIESIANYTFENLTLLQEL